jgi:hypothetical protein
MEPSEPQEPKPRGPEPGAGGAAFEALRRLEERLDRASDAAERLIAEAAARAAGAPGPGSESDAPDPGPGSDAESPAGETAAPREQKPPPAGWQVPDADGDRRAGDLELLANVVQSLRELIPPDLQRRLAEALRELLLALRALIDWYLERMQQRHREPAEVQDIPIL